MSRFKELSKKELKAHKLFQLFAHIEHVFFKNETMYQKWQQQKKQNYNPSRMRCGLK